MSNQFSSVFSDFSSKLKPIGASISKQFTQAQQYAKETIGTPSAGDITELPAEYKTLEMKTDNVKQMYENLLKVARTFTVAQNDYEPPLQETVTDFASSVQSGVFGFAAAASEKFGVNNGNNHNGHRRSTHTKSADVPKCLGLAVSRTAMESAQLVGTEEPLGAALSKTASAYDRIGSSKLQMDEVITAQFYNKLNDFLAREISTAMKARKNVQAIRLNYDASRASLRQAKPERMEAFRREMEAAEDEFVAAVEDCMTKMKLVAEHPMTLKTLADFITAQLAYHKDVFELAPEIDELKVTQDALVGQN